VADRGDAREVGLATIARDWGRMGVTGFGGPPAHIALLRRLCVQDRGWLSAAEFEDGIAATNLLPGPASTQLAIFCAWRLRGMVGALVGGLCFICPGLALIVALSAVFLASDPPRWVLGAAAGASAAVPAVAVSAAVGLIPASWRRVGADRARRARWVAYLLAGGIAAAVTGPFLVLVLIGCGLIEVAVRRPVDDARNRSGAAVAATVLPVAGGIASLVWVAFKVGALSYGGGFVIIPLMQHDAVHTYHWMTAGQFLDAVALGQVTPGPVVLTVSAVGYAAAGVGGALLAALVAFAPSFAFIMAGAPHFDRLRANHTMQAFLTGAGACAIGAIGGASISLGLSLSQLWQVPVLALVAAWLLALRKPVVPGILAAAAIGIAAALAGLPVGH